MDEGRVMLVFLFSLVWDKAHVPTFWLLLYLLGRCLGLEQAAILHPGNLQRFQVLNPLLVYSQQSLELRATSFEVAMILSQILHRRGLRIHHTPEGPVRSSKPP